MKEGRRTDILDLAMFITNPTVKFNYPGICLIFRKEGTPIPRCRLQFMTVERDVAKIFATVKDSESAAVCDICRSRSVRFP